MNVSIFTREYTDPLSEVCCFGVGDGDEVLGSLLDNWSWDLSGNEDGSICSFVAPWRSSDLGKLYREDQKEVLDLLSQKAFIVVYF